MDVTRPELMKFVFVGRVSEECIEEAVFGQFVDKAMICFTSRECHLMTLKRNLITVFSTERSVTAIIFLFRTNFSTLIVIEFKLIEKNLSIQNVYHKISLNDKQTHIM